MVVKNRTLQRTRKITTGQKIAFQKLTFTKPRILNNFVEKNKRKRAFKGYHICCSEIPPKSVSKNFDKTCKEKILISVASSPQKQLRNKLLETVACNLNISIVECNY